MHENPPVSQGAAKLIFTPEMPIVNRQADFAPSSLRSFQPEVIPNCAGLQLIALDCVLLQLIAIDCNWLQFDCKKAFHCRGVERIPAILQSNAAY